MADKNNRKKVMLLEDEPVICKVLARTLEADGLEVDIANNGRIAMQKIESGNEYDLFIFDIRTPIISGIQLFEYLEEKHPDLTGKVVFATGDFLNTATGAFLERTKRPYLTKPYTPVQIKNLVRKALNLKLLPDEDAKIRHIASGKRDTAKSPS